MTDVDKDLATLRRAVHRGEDVFFNEGANAALARVEAELSRLREQRDEYALVEAALDEAGLSIHWFSALLSVIEKHDKPLAMGIVAQAGGGQIRLANLAAALRAVREGK